MGAGKKWPGGALQRAVRARMDVDGNPEIQPECLSTHRRMQVGRLVQRHRISPQRALALASIDYGEDRE